MKENEPLTGYKYIIEDLPTPRIKANNLNPRQRFNKEEEDELIESILAKGILNPIIVFKKSKENLYIILDGERRYRACKKLSIKKIPARILLNEPSKIETLSLMFHIHNVKEDWTEFAISITLKRIIEEMGKDIFNLSSLDRKEITRITSLSGYKIDKYLKFQDYPNEVIERFLLSEIEGKKEEGADPDILLEMYKPIQEIKLQMPEVIQKYPVAKIIDSCIQKKATGVIRANKEFRLLSKSLTASRKGKIMRNILKDKIVSFITQIDVTPERIYKSTSEAFYQVETIIKSTNKLYEELNDLNVKKIGLEEKNEIRTNLNRLINLFKTIFSKS